MEEGATCNVSSLTTSVHNGTHADAPLHILPGGDPAESLPLAAFVGPAVVLERDGALGLRRDELRDAVGRGTRVLLRSGRTERRTFPSTVPGIPPTWIEELARLDVPLLGTDLPSVDPDDSRELPAHRACLRNGMQILENLALAEAPPGRYRLLALPLKVARADAAPVRAVLLPEDDT